MKPTRLATLLIVAALPLAGCGNKGPLTLQQRAEGAPPSMPAQVAPADPTSVVMPAPASTVTPPPDPTQPIPEDDDGTPGTPR